MGGTGQRLRLDGHRLRLSRSRQAQSHLPVHFLFQDSTTILCPDLSALVVYLRTVPFCSFTHSKENYHIYDMSSFSESKARHLVKEAGQERSGTGSFRFGRLVPRNRTRKQQRDKGVKKLFRSGNEKGFVLEIVSHNLI